jgi:hypothetical protein
MTLVERLRFEAVRMCIAGGVGGFIPSNFSLRKEHY